MKRKILLKRRKFFNWVGLGVVASSLPVAVAACQSSQPTATASSPSPTSDIQAATPRTDGFAVIGTVADLDSKGFITNNAFQGKSVIVIRSPKASKEVLAFNSLCTHQQCPVNWETKEFVCPCHDSKFSAEGTVTRGPADQPLDKFVAKIEGSQVLVKVS